MGVKKLRVASKKFLVFFQLLHFALKCVDKWFGVYTITCIKTRNFFEYTRALSVRKTRIIENWVLLNENFDNVKNLSLVFQQIHPSKYTQDILE